MHPLFPHSTDFFYSNAFDKADLIELGHALGVSNSNVVTTATIQADRLFCHACLNGIQTYLKLNAVSEVERAKEIADIADGMYAALLPEFHTKLAEAELKLAEKQKTAEFFCQQLESIESKCPWNKTRYHNTWNTNDYPLRWQKKAIETYGHIRERVDNGEYNLPEGKTAGDFTSYWSMRNLEYKHSRDVGRSLVEDYIQTNYTANEKLTMHPANERTMVMVVGGIASGKSALTEAYLHGLKEKERKDHVLHNADYLKYALHRSAARDGAFPEGHHYQGPEVQAESSNALYEGTRKRAYLARQFFYAPNVVLNSIALNACETQEGIASGGSVIAHHLHISADDAIAESEERVNAIGGRRPSDADIRWSARVSAQSPLLMLKPEYYGTRVVVHLYHRVAHGAPRHYATIDAAHKRFTVYDKAALEMLDKTAEIGQEYASKGFIERFTDAGYDIGFERSHVTSFAIQHPEIKEVRHGRQ